MTNNHRKRGFVTIATGKQQYYQMAQTLLQSYRLLSKDNTPFAILCDRECEETRGFDDVVILENPHRSYLDKLELYRNSPYEETIFVDADALFLKNPAMLWADFETLGDFSCYGEALPLDSTEGWFRCEQTGEFQSQIKFVVQMHGGVYYFRKTQRCRDLFERALYLADHYSQYRFAHFGDPADEPVLALSMAVSDCKPCPAQEHIAFVPSYEWRLRVTPEGQVQLDRKATDAIVLHFATHNVSRFLYRYLKLLVECRSGGGTQPPRAVYRKLRMKCLPQDIKIPLVRGIKRGVKYALPAKVFIALRKMIKKS